MRYFLRLNYRGTAYSGWQKQQNATGVQEVIEKRISQLVQDSVQLVGCGRTDAGVHAMNYVAHVELNSRLPEEFLYRINRMLPKDVAIVDYRVVSDAAHARYDAISRSYQYRLHSRKNPFRLELSTHWPGLEKLDVEVLHELAKVFIRYDTFFPFCKTGSDNKTMDCEIKDCHWKVDLKNDLWMFHIRSDRFLRGMVRMMVGICLRVAEGQETIETVDEALRKQVRLVKSYSAPPQGLFFTGVEYPFYQTNSTSDGSRSKGDWI